MFFGKSGDCMVIRTFRRCENKYLVTEDKKNELLKRFEPLTRPDAYCIGGKTYSIYNIYYDTPDNQLIRNSISKPPYKEKLRLRSYYPVLKDDDELFLEVKKKVRGIVSKRRIVLTKRQAEEFLKDGIKPELKDVQAMQVLREIEYMKKIYDLRPAVYISYDRIALYANDDDGIRITFDQNVLTRRYDLDFDSGPHGEPLLKDGYYIMEIKCGGSYPFWLVKILGDCEVHPRGYSKYGKEYVKHCKEEALLKNG